MSKKIKNHKASGYHYGDHLVVCDRTGRVIHSSEAVEDWTGITVHYSEYDGPHPQDFLKVKKDNQSVPGASPDVDGGETVVCTAKGRDSRVGYATVGCSVVGLTITL